VDLWVGGSVARLWYVPDPFTGITVEPGIENAVRLNFLWTPPDIEDYNTSARIRFLSGSQTEQRLDDNEKEFGMIEYGSDIMDTVWLVLGIIFGGGGICIAGVAVFVIRKQRKHSRRERSYSTSYDMGTDDDDDDMADVERRVKDLMDGLGQNEDSVTPGSGDTGDDDAPATSKTDRVLKDVEDSLREIMARAELEAADALRSFEPTTRMEKKIEHNIRIGRFKTAFHYYLEDHSPTSSSPLRTLFLEAAWSLRTEGKEAEAEVIFNLFREKGYDPPLKAPREEMMEALARYEEEAGAKGDTEDEGSGEDDETGPGEDPEDEANEEGHEATSDDPPAKD